MGVQAILLWLFLAPGSAQFQANASHILFGDLKIVEQSSDVRLHGSFRILLKNISGQVLRRQSVLARAAGVVGNRVKITSWRISRPRIPRGPSHALWPDASAS